MGLGEGTTFPALSVLLASWVPETERSKLGSFVFGGGQVSFIYYFHHNHIIFEVYFFLILLSQCCKKIHWYCCCILQIDYRHDAIFIIHALIYN